MPSREEYRAHCDAYVAAVRDLCTVPEIRSALEDGRGKPVDHCQHLHRYLSRLTHKQPDRRAHYTVACLIAHERPARRPTTPAPDPERPVAWLSRRNLGATLARAAKGRTDGPYEKELQILIRLSEDLVHRRLPGLIQQLLAAGNPPDFAVLLADLTYLTSNRLRVATRWQDAFYLTAPTPPTAHATAQPRTQEGNDA
ncbi:type I-E CRISPR-associated protein Cse2/CasB [Streptomyces aculeolatus]